MSTNARQKTNKASFYCRTQKSTTHDPIVNNANKASKRQVIVITCKVGRGVLAFSRLNENLHRPYYTPVWASLLFHLQVLSLPTQDDIITGWNYKARTDGSTNSFKW